ncbi:hypothetical protein SAMN05421820_11425 [Pedobacter steynii]|uniref:Uncharacterized protein n=1 Tax=Pedobacter steynii TaxID=430522 RepID=A0A1H0IYG6_9SPHI|nr:hypothetical protein [Pedobacter steynii]NQX42979.1 hypothetical protein [Pedobacter steynii]SDO36537.1 hypothetical protein SAMN05421820_11425 [Pedobacter steynii]
MQYDFSQQRLLDKRHFRFMEDGLLIHSSSAGKVHEYEIKYENIGTKIIYWKNGLNAYLLVAAFFTVVSIIFYFDTTEPKIEPSMQLFLLALIPSSILLYFITYKKARYITNSANLNPIELFSDKPNIEAVDHFIDEILSRRRIFLLQRFGQMNKNLSYEPQYYSLTWLLDNEVINKEEYDQKLQELNSLYPSTPTIKGFAIEK